MARPVAAWAGALRITAPVAMGREKRGRIQGSRGAIHRADPGKGTVPQREILPIQRPTEPERELPASRDGATAHCWSGRLEPTVSATGLANLTTSCQVAAKAPRTPRALWPVPPKARPALAPTAHPARGPVQRAGETAARASRGHCSLTSICHRAAGITAMRRSRRTAPTEVPDRPEAPNSAAPPSAHPSEVPNQGQAPAAGCSVRLARTVRTVRKTHSWAQSAHSGG